MRISTTSYLSTFVLALLTACGPIREPPPDGSGSDVVDSGSVMDMGVGIDTPRTDVQRADTIDSNTTLDVEIDTGAQGVDGSGAYMDAATSPDAIECPRPDSGGLICRDRRAPGCVDREVCNDGLDNDCNGRVDDGCLCIPGRVQRCFAGPPGQRNVGACSDGNQTCQGSGEFGCWGPCEGGKSPEAETCDDSDNNCDGCVDDGLCCAGLLGSCPSPGDPRISATASRGQPFQPWRLLGRDFYQGTVVSWKWTVEGGPCDRLLYATSRTVSYTLNGQSTAVDVATENLDFRPTLSGDYTVTLEVRGTDGLAFRCSFILQIRAPGFRAELCWDLNGTRDIDFWVHRPNTMTPWVAANMCYYGNCRNDDTLDWGYSPTGGGACREPLTNGDCNNPRLDIDNISDRGVPENINIDSPYPGDKFRVAANYFSNTGRVQPMVNIYCGGNLVATYGGADVPNYPVPGQTTRFGSAPIEGFDTGGFSSGSLWRVVDVTYNLDGTCMLQPLVQRGTTRACVETNSDRSFSGLTCAYPPPPLPGSDGGVPPADAGSCR